MGFAHDGLEANSYDENGFFYEYVCDASGAGMGELDLGQLRLDTTQVTQ